jgi:hypothetical protein
VGDYECVVRHLNDFALTGIHIFYLEHDIGFQLRRWALKIMSFLVSANRLFILTQSNRLRKLILGKFSVQVLTSPTTALYSCNLSSEAIQVALDASLAGLPYLSEAWNEDRVSFLDGLREPEAPEVVRNKPTVHAELSMIMAMVKGEITHVLPYIGVLTLFGSGAPRWDLHPTVDDVFEDIKKMCNDVFCLVNDLMFVCVCIYRRWCQ